MHGRPLWLLVVLALLAELAAAGTAGAAGQASGARLHLVMASPVNGASSVSGTAPIRISFSAPLAAGSPLPEISPAIPGVWQVAGSLASFTPTGAYPPDARITVTVPGGSRGVVSAAGQRLRSATSLKFSVKGGSPVRAEQLLAELGFLPVSWRQHQPIVRGLAAFEKSAFRQAPGSFRLLGQFPPLLWSLWQGGSNGQVFETGLAAFEKAVGLPETGGLTAAVWADLLRLGYRASSHHLTAGFTYALVSKQLPERLTIWRGGREVFTSLANTGISASPTADGTFSVYLRFENQVMSGVSPWGTAYSDPVSYVAYFHGSDAVHYIYRYSYGYPQSFGCVELPLPAAEQAWGYLQLGTLITVSG